MALADIKLALAEFIQDTMGRGGQIDYDKLTSFIVKTRANQKAQFLAWSTNRKTKLAAEKAALTTSKTFHEARIDKQIADIVDVEANF